MAYDRHFHHRHSIRLKGYDYTQPGAYFITVVAHHRENFFGEVAGGGMKPNDAGQIIQIIWDELPERFPFVDVDEFIIMPNHIHGIIVLSDIVGAGRDEIVGLRMVTVGAGSPRPYDTKPLHVESVPPTPTLGHIVAYFKYQSTKRINILRGTPGTPVWQRNYYEHIIRNADALSRIREYIRFNPAGWNADDENPRGRGPR